MATIRTGSTPDAAALERRAEQHVEDPVRQYLDAIGHVSLLTAEDEVELSKRIEAGVYAAELLRRDAAGEQPLDAGRRAGLRLVAADGAAAKERMVEANLRLVVSVARKLSRDVPLLDAVQEGNLGLIRAVEKFDWARGYKFSTYATWWIKQAIQRAVPEQTRTVRLPAHVSEEIGSVRRAERRLAALLGRDATLEEVAEETGLSAERIEDLRSWDRRPVSLDAPVGDEPDGASVGDLLERPDDVDVTSELEGLGFAAEVQRLLDELPDREARILTMRYGFDGRPPRTLKEVGEEVGLTRERVRQLEKAALRSLRGPGRRTLAAWAA